MTKLFLAVALGAFFAIRASGGIDPLTINDDAGWCWFEDERVIISGDQLIVGTVANGRFDPARRGDIDVTSYGLKSGKIQRFTLHQNLEADDHDSPAFLERPDGRILAMYCKHGGDYKIYYRITTRPRDISEWEAGQVFIPSDTSRVTYSNLHWLKKENGGKGRIYNFFRGFDNTFKPSWMFSDDFGETWRAGGVLVDFPAKMKHRPYVKYASDGTDTVHILFTEAHPRNFDNSLYHAIYRKGWLLDSSGKRIKPLNDEPLLPSQVTCVFEGDSNNVAWAQDVHLDRSGKPRVAFSVQKDSGGLPPGEGGSDHRYHFARWDGTQWHDAEIAYAGSKLYPGEDDYTGGICLHPDDDKTVFISTNVDPVTGRKLESGHYEIFRGQSADKGASWKWSPVTQNSTVDNLRPIVPHWKKGKTALLWLRGKFPRYTQYELEAVLRIYEK
jgi:hypothetical protein